MSWLENVSAAWRWWNEQCVKYDCRYDTLKAERVLTAMAAEQQRQPGRLAFSAEAIARLVGVATSDLSPVLASLERDAAIVRDLFTGRYALAPIALILTSADLRR